MNKLRWPRKSKKIFALSLLFILAFSWSALYLSSLYQRRKAERLVVELRTFPFATADFAEVRDFAMRHGGKAMPEPSLTPPFGCAAQSCIFQIWLGHPFSRPPANRWLWQFLYPTLSYVGLRPWSIYVQFEVRSGLLARSSAMVGQLRRNDVIEYSIHTERTAAPFFRPDELTNDYVVVIPHVTGPPTEALIAWVMQTPDAPMNQVFDVDLRCFTKVFHGCPDLSTLAPSAWRHYREKMKTP